MRRKALFTLIVLISLVASAAAANNGNGFDRESMDLVIGQSVDLTPRVQNQLEVQDVIEIRFKGRAAESGLVDWDIEESSTIDCDSTYSSCNITVDPQSSKRFNMRLRAQAFGEGNLIMEGTSHLTKLSGQDTIQVSVDPQGQSGRSAPGMSMMYVLVVLLMATGYLWFRQ